MKKYLYIMSSEIKDTLIYRGNTWLTALFSTFSVILAYLLWKAVFGETETFNGFTLPQMTTYYLLSGILSPLTQSDGLLEDFSADIKGGSYAKFMVKPLSPLGYFISAGFAKTLFPTLTSITALSAAMLGFHQYFEPVRLINVLQALPVIILGAVLSMLIGYIISMTTFRFTDIGFLYVIQNIVKSFLAGSLLPLNMVFGEGAAMWSPFSYTLYYPVVLSMGKADIPPLTAVGVLTLWVLLALAACILLQKRAPRAFEGVGL